MKIITSNTSRGAYLGILEQLKRNISDGLDNIVIAPDRFTASVQRALLAGMEDSSVFNLEVLAFSKLAERFIPKKVKKCLTPEGSVMLITQVIQENNDSLGYYKNAYKLNGFATELYASITALRNSGITADELLEKSSDKKLSTALKKKAKDIASIYSKYVEQLSIKYDDSTTILELLKKELHENPDLIKNKHFYITDIYEFTRPQLDIIEELNASAYSLTIAIPSGYDNDNARIYPDEAINKLTMLGSYEIVTKLDEITPVADAISTQLFSYSDPSKIVDINDEVELRQAKDKYDEVLALCMDIIKGIKSGRRYKNFEVFVPEIEEYAEELKAAFSRYNIPFYLDNKALLIEQTKTKYILEAIAVVTSNFRKREVLDFVKNPLFYVNDENKKKVFEFENYVLKYNIEYSRFDSPFTLKDDYNKTIKSAKVQKLDITDEKCTDKVDIVTYWQDENDAPNVIREKLIKTLEPFKYLTKEEDVANIVSACKKVLDGVEEAWQLHVDKLSDISLYYRKCSEQVDGKILSIFDEMIDILKDKKFSLEEFELMFGSMVESLKISLVPTSLDCVFVGDYNSRFMGQGDVFIMGAINSKIPSVSGGGTIINPKDEIILENAGVTIVPNERTKLLSSMYAICDLMKKPEGRLVVSYPSSSSSNNTRPSLIFAELSNMFRKDGDKLKIKQIDFTNPVDYIDTLFSTKDACYQEVLRNLIAGNCDADNEVIFKSAYEALDEDKKKSLEGLFEVPEKIEIDGKAYFKDTTSVSRLEKFYSCPYSHYFSYMLGLRKRNEAEFQGTENGTIIHAILEQFFKDIKDGKIKDESNFVELCEKYFDISIKENKFETLLEKPSSRRILLRVKKESVKLMKDLWEVHKRSKFMPAYVEAVIGEDSIKPMTLKVGDFETNLKGKIDRIDALGDKFIVIDYKTFKSADLKDTDLYYGKKIQLYIYMKAVEESLGTEPVGVFYFPIYSNYDKPDADRYKYKGKVTNDRDTLIAIDDMISAEPKEAIIPYSANKDGSLKPEKHIDRKTFDMYGDYAKTLAAKGAELIKDGYIKPSPIGSICDYCDFGSICPFKGKDEYTRKPCNVTSDSFKMGEEGEEKDE